MDYLNGKTLDEFAERRKDSISFWTKIYLLRGVINGLQFISSYKIVHMDIKPTNIVVVKDLLTKIIDFGESYNSSLCNKSNSI